MTCLHDAPDHGVGYIGRKRSRTLHKSTVERTGSQLENCEVPALILHLSILLQWTAENTAKGTSLPCPLHVRELTSFQLQGASPPDPLTRGSAPGPRWGLCPHTHVIGSCFTHSPCTPPQNCPWPPCSSTLAPALLLSIS